MQHRYVPDLGDFSKFVVIDALSGNAADRTALIWYLVNPDELRESHNNDGKHTTYLDQDRQGIGQCHPALYERFQTIHRAGVKHVGAYARHEVLSAIDYFAEPLSYEGLKVTERERWRVGWLERAEQACSASNLVVLDPDNGLMSDRVSLRSQAAIKYAALHECEAFYASGRRSLIVYQHGHRTGTIAEQAGFALDRLTSRLDVPRDACFALRFHRGTSRCYLVVPARGELDTLRSRAQALVAGPWGQRGHFSLLS